MGGRYRRRMADYETRKPPPIAASNAFSQPQTAVASDMVLDAPRGVFTGPVSYRTVPAASHGGGRALPDDVRARMEHAFGADLSAIRIHEGPSAEAAGADAY